MPRLDHRGNMANKKKKRTILMSEDSSEVSPPPLSSKVKSFASSVSKVVRPRSGGLGGTIAKIERKTPPPVKIKWKVGVIKSKAKSSSGRTRGKPKLGFQIKVKF